MYSKNFYVLFRRGDHWSPANEPLIICKSVFRNHCSPINHHEKITFGAQATNGRPYIFVKQVMLINDVK